MRVVEVRSPETIASKVDSDETPVRRSRPYLKYMLAWTAGLSFEAGARAGAFSGSLDRPCARARACSGVGKVVPRGSSFSRSEEHTSELQSLMRISYAVFCLKKTKKTEDDQINR